MKRHRRQGVRSGWRSGEAGLVANMGKRLKSSISAWASRAGEYPVLRGGDWNRSVQLLVGRLEGKIWAVIIACSADERVCRD